MPDVTMTYDPDAFADLRHIGPSTAEMAEMLAHIGADSLDALIAATVPENLRQTAPLTWPAVSEQALLARLRQIASRNRVMHSLIGQGYYGTFTPPAIRRYIFENPAWYTAYTPYQPEISQGRLEALLNFQTVVCDMTGLDVANASLLDEASAAAEAMAMAQRVAGSKAKAFFVDAACHPQTIAVLRTRASGLDIRLIVGPPAALQAENVFGAIFQYPDTYGEIRDPAPMIADLHAHKAIAVVATDLLALTLLRAPAALGADIAIGSAQRFGVPMGYGGPHAAFMAVKDDYKRQMPGRIVGVSRDSHGNPAYRLSLQTREQHIRREKATSNICTAQALLAVMAGMYAVFYGPDGLKAIAARVHARTHRLAKALQGAGFTVENKHYFDTLTLHVGPRQDALIARAAAADINLRRIGNDRLGIALDETVTDELLDSLAEVFGARLGAPPSDGLPQNLLRDSAYLTHPVFHMNRAEAGMMRYMRKLADRDLALDRAMIPLGSCTMKLNSAASMTALTWPEFANIHPFAPQDQAAGYAEAIADLSQKLCEITGYDAFSMQPNSGAQGEFAGLMTIRAYHLANGDDQRSICLIPVSAHGTNPASAQMAGMDVVVVKTMSNGDIDLVDFRAKAGAAGNCLAAVMITYPSTHGVFEESLREICAIAHTHGGQVYLDGANMNAMVGLVKPGEVGADVSHLNLHKTFAIPHGGGGPGMGPIGVKAHLAPFLPGDPASGLEGAVAAAPYGSASILLISWAYCLMMGGAGLTKATKVAILNANYLAHRLSQDYDILYRGKSGRVAHECILDPRPFAALGVTVEDIAKRLIDHGFHAPTMSWPVAGTLMIEPTESEPKAELDRFIHAMSSIRAEIAAIAAGDIAVENAALRHAPHTLADLLGPWDRPYDRAAAVLPAGADIGAKYWPPVGRIDNVFGDRNLMCTCPPLSDYDVA